MIWRDAVLNALRRISMRHSTVNITRQMLISEELDRIIKDTQTTGSTPEQTLSRVLQELRDENVLYFTGAGTYFLLDKPVHVETEDLPDDAIGFAIQKKKLKIGILPTREESATARQRRGQAQIRKLALRYYGFKCAFCDVNDTSFLVASHISRWADDPEARGDLTNVLCLCRLHDPLFEYGYLSMTNNYALLKREGQSRMIDVILKQTDQFRKPTHYPPLPEFLLRHRIRTGFEKAPC